MTACEYTVSTSSTRSSWTATVVDEDGNRGEGRGHDEEVAVWRAFRQCQAAKKKAVAAAPEPAGYGNGC